MRNLYIFILLGFHLLITSCSSIREGSSNVIARQLASITGNKPSCEKLVAEVINFEEETKLSKQYKQRVANFWNNNNKHNVDDLSWFAKYELWSSNILQSWNKNPQPIFFIEDSEKSFYVISSYKRNFKSSGQVSNSNGDVIEFSEAKEIVSTWLKRYSNFEQDINYLQKKYITLIYQTKKLKSLRREGKYPFSIRVTMFKQGQSFQEVKVFKDSGRVREFLTELKIQRNQIQSPIMHTGLLKKVQFRQASDYERLKRLHNVLENIYLTQLDKDKKSINQDLRKTLIEIESVINQKKLKPHRSFRRKFITNQKKLEWTQFKEFLVSLKENDKIVKIKEFLDSFSDEQIEILGLGDKKKRWAKSNNIVNRNRWYIGATSAITLSGGGVAGYVQFKDFLFAETEAKQECIRKNKDEVSEFVNCVNKYILEKLELENAMIYVNNGYKGLNEVLKNDQDKIDKFIALTSYFVLKRKEYLVQVLDTETREAREMARKQEILDRINPTQVNDATTVNDGTSEDEADEGDLDSENDEDVFGGDFMGIGQ